MPLLCTKPPSWPSGRLWFQSVVVNDWHAWLPILVSDYACLGLLWLIKLWEESCFYILETFNFNIACSIASLHVYEVLLMPSINLSNCHFSHCGPRHSEMVQRTKWIWLHKQVQCSLAIAPHPTVGCETALYHIIKSITNYITHCKTQKRICDES